MMSRHFPVLWFAIVAIKEPLVHFILFTNVAVCVMVIWFQFSNV